MDSYSKIDENERINNLYFKIFLLNKRNKIKFIKNNNFCNSVVKISPVLTDNFEKIYIDKLENKIKFFLETLNENCKNFNPDLFLKNFKKTFFQLKDMLNATENPKHFGSVIIDKINKFYLNSFNVIFHELLHLSSVKKGMRGTSFRAFDEGYTQLLAERYFGENVGLGYKNQVLMLELIELIIGKDVMEKNYFEGNNFKNLDELSKIIGEKKKNILLFYMGKIFFLEKTDLNNNDIIGVFINDVFNILIESVNIKLSNTENELQKQFLEDKYESILESIYFRLGYNFLDKSKNK